MKNNFDKPVFSQINPYKLRSDIIKFNTHNFFEAYLSSPSNTIMNYTMLDAINGDRDDWLIRVRVRRM